ncbi:LuxR family transcriptional regulator [Streptomyces canus]|uniref:LuxR family transcriptional regulator n=1 Tax=Streptomyces canus TaxID=58343 RepID=A0A101SI47_9ACTN|nr:MULTISPECIES: response regulator transcription factor [Streptomyces]KUN74376.1 LuxR family transcriptional regulator [Streptomyces canus]MDI5904974.1 response regulator transcription factor [Streptomyces sp. 12257]
MTSPSTPARVLVVDDQAVVRAGFAAIVDAEPDFVVVGEAGDGAEAVAQAGRLTPDVVLMDIRMPEMDGLTATGLLTGPTSGHLPKVLVLTTFDLDSYVYEALRAGASGFLLKDAEPAELLAALRVVVAGEAMLAPAITRRLIDTFTATAPAPRAEPLAALTPREREVLSLIATGLANAEIAERLGVATGTVKTHVNALLNKLDLRDRVQATIFAYDTGLVRPKPQRG